MYGTLMFCRIRSGLVLLGMAAIPLCTVCLSSTWAGLLFVLSATLATTGSSIRFGSTLLQWWHSSHQFAHISNFPLTQILGLQPEWRF